MGFTLWLAKLLFMVFNGFRLEKNQAPDAAAFDGLLLGQFLQGFQAFDDVGVSGEYLHYSIRGCEFL